MKVEKKVNKMWHEWNSMPAKLQKEIRRNTVFIAKWQYTYSAERGKIGMIRMSESLPRKTFWEIFCLEGNLFDDTEVFGKSPTIKVLDFLMTYRGFDYSLTSIVKETR
ncbi:MAG: hypothetical protein HY514_05370 [Candidatus Aenigmarchaeota archaeon]|nr:hypothetical protein [Candidatus Aenigmarchaeota archaeon]